MFYRLSLSGISLSVFIVVATMVGLGTTTTANAHTKKTHVCDGHLGRRSCSTQNVRHSHSQRPYPREQCIRYIYGKICMRIYDDPV